MRLVAPVSYTHLDVYKRQTLESAGHSPSTQYPLLRLQGHDSFPLMCLLESMSILKLTTGSRWCKVKLNLIELNSLTFQDNNCSVFPGFINKKLYDRYRHLTLKKKKMQKFLYFLSFSWYFVSYSISRFLVIAYSTPVYTVLLECLAQPQTA